MTPDRLDQILSRFAGAHIAVIGDFFLDQYLEIDPALAETSLETGLTAHQVARVRCQPGAAGTVVSNLCALGIGAVVCLGFTGEDGEGYELRRGLQALGADAEGLLTRADRVTPTYRKPLVLEAGGPRELERMDSKNRRPLPEDLEAKLLRRLEAALPSVRAVIALDQVQEAECGVVTTRMRQALAVLAAAHPEVVWFGDSRLRVGEYRGIHVKSNRAEASLAAPAGADLATCARALARRVGAPAFVTAGEEGIVYATADTAQPLRAVPVTGEIDIVGAGDSATAGLVSALCSGANPAEAAVIANLVASITIQQLGTTGTASPEQVRARLAEHAGLWGEG